MLFDFAFTVPNRTLENDPYTVDVMLTGGTIKEIRTIFPPGPAELVHVKIFHSNLQLVPTNPDGTLNFDDKTIIARMDYDLLLRDNIITLVGWSPHAIYNHTITFQFDIDPPKLNDYQIFVNALENK